MVVGRTGLFTKKSSSQPPNQSALTTEIPVNPHKVGYKALKRYCAELELPDIATHGLRHSTAGIYISHGATRDDLLKLFAHSSASVTDRYIHDKGERADQIAKVIRLFPATVASGFSEISCGKKAAKSAKLEIDSKCRVC